MHGKPVSITLCAFLLVVLTASCSQPSLTPEITDAPGSLTPLTEPSPTGIVNQTPSPQPTRPAESPPGTDWTINASNISQLIPLSEIGTLSLGKIIAVAWTPDGSRVAIATQFNVYIFNTTTWQVDWSKSIQSEVLGVYVNQNASRLLVRSREKGYLFDLQSGENLLETSNLFAVSPDLNSVAIESGILDIASGEMITNFILPAFTDVWEYPSAIEFSPDGSRVIMGMNHGSFFVWDAKSGAMSFQYRSSREERDCYQLGSTGKYLLMHCYMPYDTYSETETQIRYFTLDEPHSMGVKTVRSGDHLGYSAVALIPNRNLLAWQVEGQVRFYDLDNSALETGGQPNPAFKGGFSLSPEVEANWLLNWYDNVLQIWDLHTNSLVKQYGSDAAARIVLNPVEDRQVALSRYDGSFTLWDFESGSQLLHLASEDQYPLSAAFSPDGEQLVVGGEDGFLWVYNLTSVLTEPTNHILSYLNFNALAFAPNGNTLAAARVSTELYDYPITDGSSVRLTVAPNIYPENLKYSPDGKILAIFGTARSVELYNARGQWINSLYSRYYNETYDLAFSPDGSMLASAGGGLWLTDSYEQILEFTADTSSLAFSPDQCLLAAGQTDGSLHFWDVQTGQYLDPLNTHTDDVTGLAFSRDGRILYTASRRGSVTAWGLPGVLDIAPGAPLSVSCTAFLPSAPEPSFTITPTLTPASTSTYTSTPLPAQTSTQSSPVFQRSLYLTTPHLHGADVLALQNRLLELNYSEVGTPDADFGQKTDAAVRRFQSVNGLVQDGIVGPITWELLFSNEAISG